MKTPLAGLARYTMLIGILVVMVFPLLWMFTVSLARPESDFSLTSFSLSGFSLQNYIDIFRAGGILLPLLNSVVVGLLVTLGNILFCFTVAYSLARYRTATNRLLFATVIIVLMIPAHIVIIPMYLLMVKMGIYDSYYALVLPWLVNPIGIFLVKQYLQSVPTSMEEAARLDGASEFRIVFGIVMPLCRPVLAVLAIQVFFTNWNSFLFPFIFTQSESLRTLPVALALYQGHQAIDWQHLMAGSTIAVIPVLVVFVAMQRHIISGVTAGSIKQ